MAQNPSRSEIVDFVLNLQAGGVYLWAIPHRVNTQWPLFQPRMSWEITVAIAEHYGPALKRRLMTPEEMDGDIPFSQTFLVTYVLELYHANREMDEMETMTEIETRANTRWPGQNITRRQIADTIRWCYDLWAERVLPTGEGPQQTQTEPSLHPSPSPAIGQNPGIQVGSASGAGSPFLAQTAPTVAPTANEPVSPFPRQETPPLPYSRPSSPYSNRTPPRDVDQTRQTLQHILHRGSRDEGLPLPSHEPQPMVNSFPQPQPQPMPQATPQNIPGATAHHTPQNLFNPIIVLELQPRPQGASQPHPQITPQASPRLRTKPRQLGGPSAEMVKLVYRLWDQGLRDDALLNRVRSELPGEFITSSGMILLLQLQKPKDRRDFAIPLTPRQPSAQVSSQGQPGMALANTSGPFSSSPQPNTLTAQGNPALGQGTIHIQMPQNQSHVNVSADLSATLRNAPIFRPSKQRYHSPYHPRPGASPANSSASGIGDQGAGLNRLGEPSGTDQSTRPGISGDVEDQMQLDE